MLSYPFRGSNKKGFKHDDNYLRVIYNKLTAFSGSYLKCAVGLETRLAIGAKIGSLYFNTRSSGVG